MYGPVRQTTVDT